MGHNGMRSVSTGERASITSRTAARGAGSGLGNMRLLALLLVCALVLGEDGGDALSLLESALRRHAAEAPPSVLRRQAVEDPNLCFSLRENEEQWQLLCNDRRSNFNFNPLSLRFGKRYVHRRAVKRARTNRLSPLHSLQRSPAGPA